MKSHTDEQGVFLRSPRIAQRVFGLDSPNQIVSAVPRPKFIFFAEFNPSDGGQAMMASSGSANLNTYTGNRGISFKVKQIDKPHVNLTTVEMNQYNKKTLVYTKLEYSDATIQLHDTVDDSVLSLWVDYFTYYFGDSRVKNPTSYSQSPVDSTFSDDTGWGFRPLAEQTHFFQSIRVLAFYAGTYTSFTYINPRITSIDFHQKDYTSSDIEDITISFKYEAIQYDTFAQPFSPSEAEEKWGWSKKDSLGITGSKQNTPITAKPRIFTNQVSSSATTSVSDFSQLDYIPPTVAQPATAPTVDNLDSSGLPAVANQGSIVNPLGVSTLIGQASVPTPQVQGTLSAGLLDFGTTSLPVEASSNSRLSSYSWF